MNEVEAQLRDEFAGKALQGMLAESYSAGYREPGDICEEAANDYAKAAYRLADAMLRARKAK